LLKPGGCNQAGEVPEILPWKDISEEEAQILFNRVNKAQLLPAPCSAKLLHWGHTLDYLALNWDYS